VVQPAIESGRWVLSIDSIGNVPAPAGPGGAAGAQNGFGHMVWVCTVIRTIIAEFCVFQRFQQ